MTSRMLRLMKCGECTLFNCWTQAAKSVNTINEIMTEKLANEPCRPIRRLQSPSSVSERK